MGEEEKYLEYTLNLIRKILEEELENFDELEFKYRRDPDRYGVAYRIACNNLKILNNGILKPYFARIDFKTDGCVDSEKIYIGKYGIYDSESKPIVVDWRAPISSLYYDSEIGIASYVCPEGVISGRLTLKRQFELEDGKLLSYHDVDIVSNDNLLQKYLQSNNDMRLKNIVSTIQSEQNVAIRKPLNINTIIQGVAGSGKTTIALHRIAYLVYNYRDKIKNNQYMVIGPNDVFLKYIESVLPDLDVSDVNQQTFERFAKEIIDEDIQIKNSSKKLNLYLTNKINNNIPKFKSSDEFRMMLDLFLDDYFEKVISDGLVVKEFEVVEVGVFGPGRFIPTEELKAGEVGYLTASIKNVRDTRIGDTITDANNPVKESLLGYKKVNPMVYCGIFPADGSKYQDLRDALEKLQLNDASLQFEAETSVALGFGFRCGFLGLLHLEIIQERLEREYNLDLVTTAPSVIYKIYLTNGECLNISNPSDFPDVTTIAKMEEPVVKAEIMLPSEYIGSIMELCQQRRGEYIGMEYIEETRAVLTYHIPLNEIIYDFFYVLKSRSRGYASFDYEIIGYFESKLVKLDMLVNREVVDALSFIVHESSAQERGRKMAEKLKKEIPRHLFEIPIQAAIGNKIIARETISAMRKDVLAKCYGGDISRKRKLLEKQKEGKKRMRQIGNVEVPQAAFMSVLKLEEE